MERIRQMKKATIAEEFIFSWFNSNTNAPNVTGINKRKENLAAFSFSIPENRAEEIVIPLRDIPGKMDIA